MIFPIFLGLIKLIDINFYMYFKSYSSSSITHFMLKIYHSYD